MGPRDRPRYEYVKWTFSNVHTHIGIRKHEIGSGTKILFTFFSLRFFDMRRERHNFFNKRTAHFVDPNKIDYLPVASNLNYCFFPNPKILGSSLPGMTSFKSPVLFPIWVFYCDISDCHIRPRAREHLHSMCAPI